MAYEWFVALRFLREGRSQTVLILAGVSVGVAVMVFLSALISGLQASLIDKTLSVAPHVIVRPPEQDARILEDPRGLTVGRIEKANRRSDTLNQWPAIVAELEHMAGILAVAPTVAGSAFARKGNASRSVALRGVDPSSYARIIPIMSKIVAGQFHLVGAEAVIGADLARTLGLQPGDKLRLASTEGREDVFVVTGVFDLGNKDINERWVFVGLRTAQTMLDLPGRVSTLEVRVDDVFAADRVATQIAARTGLVADSWMKLNAQLLIALRSQSSSSYMIQFFVVLAVALGIASVLVVSVVQKSREIGILRATGTTRGAVLRIFLAQGLVVGLVGAIVGSSLGTGLAVFFASLARNADGSPIFPVDLAPMRYVLASAVSTLVGVGAAVSPARRAAGLDPATVIRNG